MKSAFGIVYDEATKGVLVVNAYGSQDITRFIEDAEITQEDSISGIMTCKIRCLINPDLD